MSALANYEALLGISLKMKACACEQAWDELAQLETQRANLIASQPAQPNFVPTVEQQSIAKIIRQIQACDQAVLEYVTPWREQAGKLLERLEHTTRPAP